jgi:hypothetical protein
MDYIVSVDGIDRPATAEEVAQIEADKARAQSFESTKGYLVKRQMEYPPIVDYLDGIVKGDQSQVQAYIDACLAVKAKYPKP